MSGPYKPGQSGNPSGRPKHQRDAAKQLARYIQEETRDGREILDFLLAVLRWTPAESLKFHVEHGFEAVELEHKQWAAAQLLDRGFGRPTQSIDLVAEVAPISAADLAPLEAFSDEQLSVAAQALLALSVGDP